MPTCPIIPKLVGVVSTDLKNVLVNMDHFPNFRGEIRKIFELPPPSKPQIFFGWHFRWHFGENHLPQF